VLKSRKKNPILPYKWLFWWVFNFRFLREDVKYVKNEVHEKEIAPLVKWSLRLPYTFLSIGSPFIEEGGKMP
jgi:hypothetical protein